MDGKKDGKAVRSMEEQQGEWKSSWKTWKSKWKGWKSSQKDGKRRLKSNRRMAEQTREVVVVEKEQEKM